MLVEAGSSIDMLNKYGISALYLAILNQNNDCAEYLIDSGAKAFYGSSRVEKDRSPIFLAIRKENEQILTKIFNSKSLELIKSFKNS